MRTITKLRRYVKAISPVISVLLMIAIAVAASLVAYAWVSGYMDFTTTKVGKSIQIQSISTNAVYVQNVGDSPVTITDVYVDDDLVTLGDDYSIDEVDLQPSDTASITFTGDYDPLPAPQVTIKIVTTDGISAEYTETFSGASGSSGGPGAVYTLTITTTGAGSVTKSPDQTTYSPGDVVTLTPVVDASTFTVWGGDLGGSSDPETITMDGDKTVSATFTRYRKTITINQAQIPGTTALTNFPVLVSQTTDSDLALRSRSDGNDIYFTFDANGDPATRLDHEIETFNKGTGNLVAWVRIPSLSATVNTDVYMFYGAQSITSPTQNPTAVWNSNYQAVYHLKEDPSGTAPQMKDSTSNNNQGTTHGSMTMTDQVNGEVNGALDLDGSNDYIEADNSASLSIGGNQITLSAWVRFTDTGSAEIIIAKPWQSSSHSNPYFAYSLHLLDSGSNVAHARIWIRTSTGTGTAESGNINANTWYYLVGTYDGSNVRIYINGAFSVSGSRTGNIETRTTPLRLGTNGGYSENFNGILDEIRISNAARSSDWISTEYNNMKNIGAFLNFGSEFEVSS